MAGYNASVKVAAFITAAIGGTAGPATGVAVLAVSGAIAAGASYGAAKSLNGLVEKLPDEEIPSLNKIILKTNFASYLKESLKLKKQDNFNTWDTGSKITIYPSWGNEREIGDIHNKILKDLLNLESNTILTRGTNPEVGQIEELQLQEEMERMDYVIEEFKKANMDLEMLENSYSSLIEQLNPLINNTSSYYDFAKEMKNEGVFTENVSNIWTLFFKALESTNDISDINIILDKYYNVVENSSDLTQGEKSMIIVGLNTAEKTIPLWKSLIIEK